MKTRLVPPLDAEAALRLYRAFLADQLAFVARFAGSAVVEWWADGPDDPPEPGPPAPAGVAVRDQGPGDLGARLARAFARAAREGATATVVIGADSPTLPAARVREAFARLESGAEAVLAPADDGGYVLIGLGRPCPELFRAVPWGGPEVARVTRARAAEAGRALVELAPGYDVDDGRGLRRLVSEIARPAARRRAPETAACLLDLRATGVI